MDKILSSEIADSSMKIVGDRLSSPVYGTFLIFWVVFHWRFIVSILFVSDDVILRNQGVLKDLYLTQQFFDYSSWIFWALWILPLLFTYFAIWIIPKYILLPAFKEEEENRVKKINIRLELEEQIVSKEVQLTKSVTEKLGAEEALLNAKIKATEASPTKWDEDYLKFRKSTDYNAFPNIVSNYYSGNKQFNNSGLASYLDSIGVVSLNENNPTFIENFTEKGKYFIRRMNESK